MQTDPLPLDLPAQLRRIVELQRLSEQKELASQAAIAASQPSRQLPTITERLTKKFGLGEDPRKRRALYAKLEKLAEGHADLLRDLISEAVAESVGARAPDRYFCRAIRAKLRHLGLGYNGSDEW